MRKIMEVSHLKKYYSMGKKQILKAVDDVSFTIHEGQTLGLVGESGCGKTTCGRTCIGMLDRTDGQVLYRGKDISTLGKKDKADLDKDVQIIFQDPYASLDPRMTVMDIIAEGIDLHHMAQNKKDRQERVFSLLNMVGLNKEHAGRYAHEFSGGQRQRIGIARALAVDPKFILCDEPISALDVSIQAQIVNLLMGLQRDMQLTYLFIAHDLSMVKYISDIVAVMYLGTIVEMTSSGELYGHPAHPYTKALLSAIPLPDPDLSARRERILLKGDVPSPINPRPGCRFYGRCPIARDLCLDTMPPLKQIGNGHYAACHCL